MKRPVRAAILSILLALFTLTVATSALADRRTEGVAKAALKKAEKTASDLDQFKLEVAENYAKNGFIRDVEDRLGKRFDAIVTELHGMRSDLQDAIINMAGSTNKRTRR